MDAALGEGLAASDKLGRVKRIDDAQARYVEIAKASFPKSVSLSGLRIVVDCANGAAYKVAPTALYELGAEVFPIGVRPNGMSDTPQFQLDIDQAKAGALGLSLADVNNTVSVAWAGTYVNDFSDRGRVKKVYVQGDAPFRNGPEDFSLWYVRNGSGGMPLGESTAAVVKEAHGT